MMMMTLLFQWEAQRLLQFLEQRNSLTAVWEEPPSQISAARGRTEILLWFLREVITAHPEQPPAGLTHWDTAWTARPLRTPLCLKTSSQHSHHLDGGLNWFSGKMSSPKGWSDIGAGSRRIIIPGNIQKYAMEPLGPCFSAGLGSAGLMVGLGDHRGFFQPKWFHVR